MLKRTMAAALVMTIAMVAGPVAAQVCSVGAYADSDGQSTLFQPTEGEVYNVYVVLFTEGLANAVSYRLVAPGSGVDYVQVGAAWGPSGSGINLSTGNGENVGIGECAVGFNGYPIVVATYTFLPFASSGPFTVSIAGNADENPDFPVYSDCNGGLHVCDIGPTLTIEGPVATEAASFGAVKSLYRN